MRKQPYTTLTTAAILTAVAVSLPARADDLEDEANRPTSSIFATRGRFGLGLEGGGPVSGVTGKLFLAGPLALQTTVGFWYCYGYCAGFSADLDLVVEMPRIWGNRDISINWNIGGGGVYLYDNPAAYYVSQAGFEGVVGLGLQLHPVPLEFVVEFRPTFIFGYDAFGFWPGASASIRYFFGH